MASCLLELSTHRKNKISLTDYNYQKDIENRLLMAQFTSLDLEVLEEILYSSIQIPVKKLSKNLDIDEETLVPVLQKLSKTGLFLFEKDTIVVDKEMRKYFESQILKFDEDFEPGMEFLQSLLRKVPIHILPIWYSIPRTSNNIFDSLVEKYLLTPQIFQRYIMELNFGEPVLKNIIEDVYQSDHFEVSSQYLMDKYQISRELFEEYMLHLEFSFVCCLGYKRNGNLWEEKVTPFHEWREYLSFLKQTEVTPIPSSETVQPKRPNDFSFAQDLSILLEKAKKKPIPIQTTSEGWTLPDSASLSTLLPCFAFADSSPSFYQPYLHQMIAKLCLLKLADIVDKKLYVLDAGTEWLEMRLDNKALYLYRHPLNKMLSADLPIELCTEKSIKEAEKSIVRVLQKNWVYFDEFIKGVHVPLTDDLLIILKRIGKNWKYSIPEYSDSELELLHSTIFEWLFEAGIVQIGMHNGRECFRVTLLGQTLFAR
jgi:predicted transcriptional regulator